MKKRRKVWQWIAFDWTADYEDIHNSDHLPCRFSLKIVIDDVFSYSMSINKVSRASHICFHVVIFDVIETNLRRLTMNFRFTRINWLLIMSSRVTITKFQGSNCARLACWWAKEMEISSYFSHYRKLRSSFTFVASRHLINAGPTGPSQQFVHVISERKTEKIEMFPRRYDKNSLI